MIPYSALILLLVSATLDGASASGSTIDWTECKTKDAHCVVFAKCNNPNSNGDLLKEYDDSVEPAVTCHIGVSIRPFNDKNWLIRLQVTTDIDPEKGIHIYSGTEQLLGCVLTGTKVEPQGKQELGAVLFGNDNSLTSTGGICSFLLKDASSLPALAAAIKIQYTKTGQPTSTELTGPAGAFFAVKLLLSCDPFTLKPRMDKLLVGFKKEPIPDILGNKIECASGIVLYAGPANYAKPVSDFVCDKANKKYTFKKEGDANPIDFEERDEVFCAIPIERTCKLPAGLDQRHFRREPDGKTTLQCDKSLWLMNGNLYYNESIVCKNGHEIPYDGVWTIQKDGQSLAIDKVECTDIVNCTKVETAKYDGRPPDRRGNQFVAHSNEKDQNIKCTLSGTHLEVYQNDTAKLLTPSTITCDLKRGIYVLDQPAVDLQKGAVVYCAGAEKKSEALASAGSSGTRIIWILLPLALVLVVGGFVLVWILNRRAWKRHTASKAASKAAASVPEAVKHPSEKSSGNSSPSGGDEQSSNSEKSEGSERSVGGEAAAAAVTPGAAAEDKFIPWEFKFEKEAWSAITLPQKLRYLYWMIKRQSPKAGWKMRLLDRKVEALQEAIKATTKMSEEWQDLNDQINEGQKILQADEERGKTAKGKKEMKEEEKQCNQLRVFSMPLFLDTLDFIFNHEPEPLVWKAILPFLFFLERTFYHCTKMKDGDANKIISNDLYNKFRRYLLDNANKLEENKGADRGFVRGVAYILQYKLNKHDKPARKAVVEKLYEMFKDKGMDLPDASRMAIWGILAHEDNPTTRNNERLETGDKNYMRQFLLDEYKKLIKEPLEPRPFEGSKMQHVLFAIGCSTAREDSLEVWKSMKPDYRFLVTDYMFLMYGRDWLWDGAWHLFSHAPADHMNFCHRFGQECWEYRELAEICVGYWADSNSADAEKGCNFEGFMRKFNPNFAGDRWLQRIYDRYGAFFANMKAEYESQMLGWLDKKRGAAAPAATAAAPAEATGAATAAAATKKPPQPSSGQPSATGATGETREQQKSK